MRTPIVSVWLPSGIVLLLATTVFAIMGQAPAGQRFGFATALIGAFMHFGAAAYFLAGLKYFKAQLRPAYVLISLGLVVLGVADSQLSIVDLFGWWFWTRSGIVIIPFLVSVVLIFLGTRRLAAVLQLGGRWYSLPTVLTCGSAIGIAAALLPHAPTGDSELTHRFATGLALLSTAFFVFVSRNILSLRRHIGSSYINGLAWFSVALVLASVGGLQYGLALLLIPGDSFYFSYHLTNLFFMVSGWFFFRTGYAFSSIDTPATSGYPQAFRRFFGAPKEPRASSRASSLDLIVYIASLVAKRTDIDHILDNFRLFTANLNPGVTLTKADQMTLAKIYLQLEDYLAQKETMRNFTRASIRQAIQTQFDRSDLEANTFWPFVNH